MSIPELSQGRVIGQPEVIDGFITLGVKCACGTFNMIVGIPGAVKLCSNKECDWAFMMGPTTRMDASGMNWSIGWQRMPKDPVTGLPMGLQP